MRCSKAVDGFKGESAVGTKATSPMKKRSHMLEDTTLYYSIKVKHTSTTSSCTTLV